MQSERCIPPADFKVHIIPFMKMGVDFKSRFGQDLTLHDFRPLPRPNKKPPRLWLRQHVLVSSWRLSRTPGPNSSEHSKQHPSRWRVFCWEFLPTKKWILWCVPRAILLQDAFLLCKNSCIYNSHCRIASKGFQNACNGIQVCKVR